MNFDFITKPWFLACLVLVIVVIALIVGRPSDTPPTIFNTVDDSVEELTEIMLDGQSTLVTDLGLAEAPDGTEVEVFIPPQYWIWWRGGDEILFGDEAGDLWKYEFSSEAVRRGNLTDKEWVDDPSGGHLLVQVTLEWFIIELPALPKGNPYSAEDGEYYLQILYNRTSSPGTGSS